MFSFVMVAQRADPTRDADSDQHPASVRGLIAGFVMAIYAQDSFGLLPVVAALLLAVPPAVWLGRRFSSSDMLIAIYLAWTFGMVLALVAFTFPDRT